MPKEARMTGSSRGRNITAMSKRHFILWLSIFRQNEKFFILSDAKKFVPVHL